MAVTKKSVKKATGTVSKKTGNGAETQTQEPVKDVEVPAQHAVITYGSGATINLGDFNNARVYVELAYPCAPDQDELDQAYDEIKMWVDERVQAEVDEMTDQ